MNNTSTPDPSISVIFCGTPEFAVPALTALAELPYCRIAAVLTQPDRPAGRGQKLTASPIKQCAEKKGWPVLQPEQLRRNPDRFLSQLEPYLPFDFGIVAAFGQILPVVLLEQAGCSFINIHASLLPRWRGAAPIQRALLNGDRESGVSLMKMEAGLDTGPVYSQLTTPINGNDDAGSLHNRLADLGAQLLVRDLLKIYQGQLSPSPQPSTGVTYAPKIDHAETAIAWQHPATEIERQIQALSPSPGAFTFWRAQRLKILGAQAKSSRRGLAAGSPGQVVFSSPTELEVQCGEGVLALTELQLAGRRRLPCEAFVAGCDLRVGDFLHNQES